jgi:hypothetical protein
MKGYLMKRFAHKTLLLLTIFLLILLALPISALADDGEDGNKFTQTVNGYQVVLVFDEPAAVVGENQIHIRVNNSQNMPVPNANVGVSVVKSEMDHTQAEAHSSTEGQMADMPGMAGMQHDPEPQSAEQGEMAADMPSMDMSGASAESPSSAHDEMAMTSLEAGLEGGEYTGKIAIETPGHCIVRVHLIIDGKLTEVNFPMSIAQSQNGSGILLGFFAVNVAIVAVAIVLKPKPLSVPLSKRA